MAALPGGWPTLLDLAKQTDPDGKSAMVAEVLSETNEIVQDQPLYESNAPTGNRVTLRSSNPTVAFGRLNKGTARSKSTTDQRTDTIGIINPISEVDARFETVSGGNFDAYRWNEDAAFLEAINQKIALTLIYGNEASDEMAFTGLAPRFNTIAGGQVVDAGGTGADNTSIFVVDWHERYLHGIFPKGAKNAGLKSEDLGKIRVEDADGNPFMAFCTAYEWAVGLTVKDSRHFCRVANIDVSDIAGAGVSGYTGPDLVLKLIDAYAKMQPKNGAFRAIYCNVTVWAALTKIATTKANLALKMEEFAGRGLLPSFWGDPIRRVDQISNAEARVV